MSSKEAAAQLKLNPYYAGKLYRQAEGFSRGGAGRRGAAARRARRRAQGPEQARARPRGAADARRSHTAARAPRSRTVARRRRWRRRRASRRCDFLRAAVLRWSAPRVDGAVDRPHELAVLADDALGVAVGDGRLEALRQGLDRRAVAEVLSPLPLLDQDALLLLLDVRHFEETPACRGPRDGSRPHWENRSA